MKRIILSLSALCLAASTLLAADKSIILIAGTPSHAPGDHEFRAGSILLAGCLNQLPGIHATVVSNGWPSDVSLLKSADGIVVFSNGGQSHPAIKPDRLKLMNELSARGVGIGTAHYGVEVPAGDPGFAMLDWTGGYFEMFWSVNPTWTADFKSIPIHPVTRGVKPFSIYDEWYYHMRFTPDRRGITPILSVVPSAETLNRPNGPHSGNPFVRADVAKGEPQVLMWTYDRPNGGRGFGFTGGHYHKNWGEPNFRRIVLNALLWIAKVEVPEGGVQSTVTPLQLSANLDPK
jgi:type 1 glutamine amidotransferase